MVRTCQIIAVVIALLAIPAKANAIELLFPVACHLMTDCWITDHVDLDQGLSRSEDYMCGDKASDNNKSTHISLANRKAASNIFPVMASANGTVIKAQNVGGFCGEHVVIQHDDHWETSYCHLKEASVKIRKGQTVARGDVIGEIGLSGLTEWPHLSFAVTRNGMVFDPFSGRSTLEGCHTKSQPLWEGGFNPPYEPAHVTDIGFTVGRVAERDIALGNMPDIDRIDVKTPQLSVWAMLMNIKRNDQITMILENPDEKVINKIQISVEDDKNIFPIYFVTRRKDFLWPSGYYKGSVTITRDLNGSDITVGQFVKVELVDSH